MIALVCWLLLAVLLVLFSRLLENDTLLGVGSVMLLMLALVEQAI